MKEPGAAQDINRSEAQVRVDGIRVFRAELDRLQHEGILDLTPEQRAAVTAHHDALLDRYAGVFDIDRDSKAKQLSLGMRVASFLGALALAASAFFLVHQFWGLLSTLTQVAVLTATSLATFGLTVFLQGRDSSGYFSKLAAMVAFACFTLNIAVFGQIFNISPSDKAFLPWAAYAFLLAYACDLRLLLAAGILCIIAFVAARVGTFGGMYWLDVGERPENFFPAALLLLAFPQLLGSRRFAHFAPVFRVFGLLALFVPMLVLANWGRLSYLDLGSGIIEGGYQVLGFLLCGVAIWWGVRRNMQDVVNTAMTMAVVFLYTKMFDWWWEAMPKYLFFLVLGLSALLILLILRRLRAFIQPGRAP